MAHIIEDRVLEQSTTAGLGAFTLAGAMLGYRAFAAVCTVADTVWYYIEAVDSLGKPSGSYEYGLGTYSGANTLTRTTVRGSSNSGAAVDFAAGTKYVGIGVMAPATGVVQAEWRKALNLPVCIYDYMTAAQIADAQAYTGSVDMASAAALAHATGRPVYYPHGMYKHVGAFPACEGGILGEGWSTEAASKYTCIKFYNCTTTTAGAITPKQSIPKSNFFRIENILILASSWDGVTGCLGYGLDIGAPTILRNVSVQGFKKSNIFVHQVDPVAAPYVTAPYESLFENVVSTYAGQHGMLIGAGANVVTLVNYQGKWCGAPSYNTAPSVAGSYDGLYIGSTADGNDITVATPQAISIIGGDCSYNSRYGWNLDEITNSGSVFPGYAEGNLTKQARIGNTFDNMFVVFGSLFGNTAGFQNDQVNSRYFYTSEVRIGGKVVHPAFEYQFISNPAAEDYSGGIVNAPSNGIYLSRSNDATHSTYFVQNQDPEGNAVSPAGQTALTLRGAGTYFMGIGSGPYHMKVGANYVSLPAIHYQATASGWSAATVLRIMDSAAPVSGTHVKGSIVWNTNPTAGGFIGWVCTTAGTPGTWKTFGAISA